jgi:hypothetical protein
MALCRLRYITCIDHCCHDQQYWPVLKACGVEITAASEPDEATTATTAAKAASDGSSAAAAMDIDSEPATAPDAAAPDTAAAAAAASGDAAKGDAEDGNASDGSTEASHLYYYYAKTGVIHAYFHSILHCPQRQLC